MKDKFLNAVMVLLCIITLYAAIEVVKFIDQSKKDQQKQIEVLHEISHTLKKIKAPTTIDATVQAGATIIINERP